MELDEVPQNLIDAVVSIEDARFWEHNGIDVKSIGGAFISTFFRGHTQGGSTITCQSVSYTHLLAVARGAAMFATRATDAFTLDTLRRCV